MADNSNLIPLGELTKDRFESTIASASNALLAPPSLDAVWNTVAEVQKHSSSFSPQIGALCPSLLSLVYDNSVGYKACGPILNSSTVSDFLVELVRVANEAANSNACSSILAGQASESDDYGDVGILLSSNEIDPSYGLDKNARAVLSRTGLDISLPSGQANVSPLSLSKETSLPTTIQYTPGDPSVQRLSALIAKLENLLAFTLDCSGDGGVVFHILLGKLRAPEGSAWVGLLGVGIWSG